MSTASISNEKKSIIWVCGFDNNIYRDWCGTHIAYHTEKEAKKHLTECKEKDKCDMYVDVDLIG